MRRIGLRRAFGVVVVLFGLSAGAAASPVPTVQAFGTLARDPAAGPCAAYGSVVMADVFALAGVESEPVAADPHAPDPPATADVILSTFRTTELLETFDFPLQPLCPMPVRLYAPAARARQLRTLPMAAWPSLRVAYAPVLPDEDGVSARFFTQGVSAHEPDEYPDSCAAEEAVHAGRADVLLLCAPDSGRPRDLEEVGTLGARNVYFAVRRTRPDLFRQLSEAYRKLYVEEVAFLDAQRQALLGVSPPANRVRVAAHVHPGVFSVSGDNCRQGLISDWMEQVAQSAGWQLDWVYGSLTQGTTDVAEGRLDIVAGVTDSPERRNLFWFTSDPIGQLQLFLWTHPDLPYEPNEVETWKGMRIGCLRGANKSAQLAGHLTAVGAQVSFVFFDTDVELNEAYTRREVDAVLSMARPEFIYEKKLLVLVPEPVYICAAKPRVSLAVRVTGALDQIRWAQPRFAEALQSRYAYQRGLDMSDLLPDERAWLEARHLAGGVVTVDISPMLFDSTDDKDEFLGYGRMLFDELSRRTGLTFQMAPLTDLQTARTRFLRGETDLWAPYPVRHEDLYGFGEKVFSVTLPQYYARRADQPVDILTSGRIAVSVQDRGRLSAYSKPSLLKRLVYCRDARDCYQALVDGRAECTFSPIMLGGRLVEEMGLERRIVSTVIYGSAYHDDYELLAGPKAPAPLVSILRKAAQSIDGARMGEFFETREMERLRDANLLHRYLGLSTRQVEFALRVLGALVFVLVVVALFIQKRAWRREREADRRSNEAKSYFFSTVSHDIRTPLNAIIGYAELLKTGDLDATGRHEALEAVVSSGNVLKELINDVLDLSKLESGKMEICPQAVDVAALVREVTGSFALACSTRGIELVHALAPLPPLLLDPQRLRQVLFNLVGNAVKFTEKGSITVSAVHREGRLELSVQDTGCGIDPKFQARLMDPYVQATEGRRQGGTGLGLAICNQLARRMGGTLTLVSACGQGSTFTFAVPAAPAPAVDDGAARTCQAPAPQEAVCVRPDLSVLIVDDTPVNLRVLAALLRRLGCARIVEATDGRTALAALAETPVDLVLTDLWMPGMDGAELVAEIRRQPAYATLPVYALTADVEIVKNQQGLGFTGVVLKPITLVALRRLFATFPKADEPKPCLNDNDSRGGAS